MNRRTELHRFEWNGILLEVTYEPEWLPPGILGAEVAHLQIQSIYPTNAPLPITETDYRSHFHRSLGNTSRRRSRCFRGRVA